MTESLFIIVPAYNESENIESFIESWYPIIESHNAKGSSRLVIINDGSKDNTFEKLYRFSKSRPLLTVLNKKNSGHGSTILSGYRYAIKHGASFIFQTDSDGQTDPNEFELFWNKRILYDAVFGNRTDRGDGISRVLVEKILCLIVYSIFGTRIPDANAPFRLMKRQYLEKHLKNIPRNYDLPNVMLTTLGIYCNDNVLFIPISFKPRQSGNNKMNMKKIIKVGFRAIRSFKVIRRRL